MAQSPLKPRSSSLKEQVAAAGRKELAASASQTSDSLKDLATTVEWLLEQQGQSEEFKKQNIERLKQINNTIVATRGMRQMIGYGVAAIAIFILAMFYITVFFIVDRELLVSLNPNVKIAMIVASFGSSVALLAAIVRGVFSNGKIDGDDPRGLPENFKPLLDVYKASQGGKNVS
jgi:hypothetical protein